MSHQALKPRKSTTEPSRRLLPLMDPALAAIQGSQGANHGKHMKGTGLVRHLV
ncbi:hypothetical protein TRAPUB_13647 [Trametes pubescens]|uniref:Uncharacterized protein n=1 Tax=Trametes pubescens TaxID=154538 RepID=A0A1M2VQL7_TRAPU|nr:hypothetical protein TRAPUB_13647 [Trametes pubescens]